MSNQNRLILSSALLVALLLAACQPTPLPFECTDAIGCVTIAPGQPLKLGVLMALSGGPAPAGLDQTRGVELALAARNDQLLGHPIELIIEDERCSSEGGTIAAMKVVADPQVPGGGHCRHPLLWSSRDGGQDHVRGGAGHGLGDKQRSFPDRHRRGTGRRLAAGLLSRRP